jgi:hypothetical protein
MADGEGWLFPVPKEIDHLSGSFIADVAKSVAVDKRTVNYKTLQTEIVDIIQEAPSRVPLVCF